MNGATLCNALIGLTEDDVAYLRSLDKVPTWWGDQFDAASRTSFDVLRLVMPAADFSGLRELPPAMAVSMFDTLLGGVTDRPGSRTCIHCPHPSRPALVFGAAWMPGLLVCMHCIDLTMLPHESRRNHTCDVCGRYDHGQLIAGGLQLGQLLYAYGLCTGCESESGSAG